MLIVEGYNKSINESKKKKKISNVFKKGCSNSEIASTIYIKSDM